MAERKRVECPFCCELILPDAVKCRFCMERLDQPRKEVAKDPSVAERPAVAKEVCKGEDGGGLRWRAALLLVLCIVLVIAAALYEMKAREVLDYALGLEKKQKYEVAHLAYRAVARKYSLSFAASEAITRLSQIDADFLGFELPELEPTFFEKISDGRFDSCVHYGLPVVASVACGVGGLLIFLISIVQFKRAVLALFLAVLSSLFFVVQATAYSWIDVSGSFFDVCVRVMGFYRWVYVASYTLLLMTAIATLRLVKR